MKTVRCFPWLGFIVAFLTATTALAQTAPVFQSQPSSQTVSAGQTAGFWAEAEGNPAPNYQWQRLPAGDSIWANLSDTTTYSGTATGNFSLAIAIPSLSGDRFRCIATNASGSVVSSVATLSVTPAVAPIVYNLPAGNTVNYGDHFSLSASVSGTSPITYQWKKNGVNVAGGTAQSYFKSGVTTADAGQYTLTATNYAGTTTSGVVVVTVNPAVAPTLYNVTAGVAVNSGETVNLSLGITGTQPMTYQWKKNGVILVDETSYSFSKNGAVVVDSGQYTLTATNIVGVVTSSPISVTVNPAVAAAFFNMPQNVNVAYGGSIFWYPSVTGTQPITYQWKKDGVVLPGATSNYFSKSNLTTPDSGLYTLMATNSVGTVTSSAITVSVNTAIAPSINGQSASINVNAGESVNLSISVSGTSPFTYQWKKDGVNLANGTSYYYSKNNAGAADAGQYTVVATNMVGTVTSTVITVTVNPPVSPVISNLPSSIKVSYGGSFGFYPSIGGTQPLMYQWKKDGVNVANGTLANYSKSNVTTADAGQYTITATNSTGTVTSSIITVTIDPPTAPVITSMPSSLTVSYGGYINIYPSISGTQPMTFQWKKSDVAIPNGTSSSYSKSGITSADAGQYTLTATNSAGSVTSAPIAVAVTQAFAPVITNIPSSLTVNYGEPFNFSPSISGTEPIIYQWKKEGVAVPNATANYYSKSVTTTADSGQYTLTATNAAGTTTTTAIALTVNPAVAPSIVNLPAVIVINYGDTLNIVPSITGTGPMNYVWKRNGAVVPGAVSAGYYKADATTTDSGQYTVTVTNPAGTVTSAAVTVTVNAAVSPAILNLPTVLTLAYGDSLNIYPVVSGTQPMTYQWTKGGVALVGGATASYSKNYVTTADSGQYALSVTNPAGTVTSTAVQVTVKAAVAPAIVYLPGNVTVDYGDSLNLYPEVTGTQPIIYQWKRNGVDLAEATYSGYSKGGTTTADSGQYTLTATNLVSTVTSGAIAVTVKAAVAPIISQQPASVTIVAGSTAVFSVSVTGTNQFTYQWSFNGQPLAGATNSTLPISNAQPSHAGSYRVTITNPGGSITTNAATLTISAPVGVVAAAAGMNHSLLIKSDGSCWAMGQNEYGQLGDSTNINRPTAVQIAAGVVATSAGRLHSLILKSDGTLWATGNNSSGQLGDGTTTSRSTPVQIATNVVAASAGGAHSLLVKLDGTLWAMGDNSYGQLGDGTTTNRSAPVKIANGVLAAAAGNGHSLFITSDGTLWAMGLNYGGQLGDGTSTYYRSTAVQIASGAVTVAAGANHSLFTKSNGTLWATGYNGSGQLGDGTTNNRSSPVQIATGVTLATASYGHSLFVKSDATLWAMGSNSSGQLGQAEYSSSSPVQIASGVSSVSAGYEHSLFIKTDGTLWAMGANHYGQLGDGTNNYRYTPVQTANGPLTVPTAPTGLIATDGTLALAIRISWSPTVGATAYEIWRSTTNDSAAAIPVAGNVLSALYYDRSVATGTTYYYWVNAVNAAGTSGLSDLDSGVAAATESPVFITQPVNQTVVTAGSATFTVGVSGTPAPAFQWQKNGVDINGATNGSYTIANTVTGDAGSYRVMASNSAGSVTSDAAVLMVTTANGNAVAYGADNFPLSASAGTVVNFSYTVTNTGTKAWGATHYLALQRGDGSLVQMVSLSGTAVGENGTVTFSLPTPATPGTYQYRVQPLENGVEWFGSSVTLSLDVTTPVLSSQGNALAYGTNTFPLSASAGSVVNFSYTVTNAGTKAWGPNHYLALLQSDYSVIQLGSLDGTTSGGTKTVTLSLPAPATPGTYQYRLQPLENEVEWFGSPVTLTLIVTPAVVSAQGNALAYGVHSFPLSASAGSVVDFNYNVSNLGTKTWGSNHYLALLDAGFNLIEFADLNGIAPGGGTTARLSFPVPGTPGTYQYIVRPLENGVEWFGTQLSLTLIVTPAVVSAQGNALGYGTTTFPVTVNAGATVNFTYNVKNLGTKAWSSNHYLALLEPGYTLVDFGDLNATAAGGGKAAAVSFTAPVTPGTYHYILRPLENGLEWFGTEVHLTLTVH